jgi:hypothetical protein
MARQRGIIEQERDIMVLARDIAARGRGILVGSAGDDRTRRIVLATLFPLLFILLFQAGCSIPRHIWQEDDVQVSEVNDPASAKRVLIASGESDFKESVIERVKAALEPEGVYIKVIGLGELEGQSVEDYDAVVLMNRCVAWGMDPHVDGFMKQQDSYDNIIVLTTSGDGGWLPDTTTRDFDAISAASKHALVDETAGEIVDRVLALLE